MSSNSSDDEESDELSNAEDEDVAEEEEVGEFKELSELDRDLFDAVTRNDVAAVHSALRIDANVNCSIDADLATPLMKACAQGYDKIVRSLLEAGADARSNNRSGFSAIHQACVRGLTSTTEILVNHDEGLLEIRADIGWTPLFLAIDHREFEIVLFLLDRGANALATDEEGLTALMIATDPGTVRRLLAAGVDVEAHDRRLRTALHYAARYGSIDVVRELIVEHDANMFARDIKGETPFDFATRSNSAGGTCALFTECYGNKLIREHGRLAIHAILRALRLTEYSFAIDDVFHPPLNPLRIRLQLGKLTLNHFRTLLSSLDAEMIRNRDDSGKLPIHMACRSKAPVEVLSVLTEMDPTTLQIADDSGALPMHLLCGSGMPAEYASVRYLMEQGGVGTLAARNRDGALPLHVVLCGSANPSLRTIQYMIESFSGSVAALTNYDQYPFMIAADETSTASLSVTYELVRANPRLASPN